MILINNRHHILASMIVFASTCAIAAGVTPSSMKNKWAYDHMNPEKSNCVQVSESWIKKASSSEVNCKVQSQGYSEKYKGPVTVCEGKGFNQMILDTRDICIDNLETEKANAP
jgi:hypothetical protein